MFVRETPKGMLGRPLGIREMESISYEGGQPVQVKETVLNILLIIFC